MKKEDINLIKKTWANLAEAAHKHYDNILSTKDLLDLKVSELQELTTFSRSFLAQMENLFCDFRHIIGMGELKANDQSKIVSIFKDITQFRSDAKRLANITSLDFKAGIPTKSKYELKTVPNILLISQLRPGQESYGFEIEDEDHSTGTIADNTDGSLQIHKVSDKLIKITFNAQYAVGFRKMFNEASNILQDPRENLNAFIDKLDAGKFGGCTVNKINDIYEVLLVDSLERHPIFTYFRMKAK